MDWLVAMRPGLRRKLEPGSEETLVEKLKASMRAKVEHPFLRMKRVFGYWSLEGALPGSGEEHSAPGNAAGSGQPDDGPAASDGVAARPLGRISPAAPLQTPKAPAGG